MLQPLPSCAAVPALKGFRWQQLSKTPLWLSTRCCAVRPAGARSTLCHGELLTFVHLNILLLLLMQPAVGMQTVAMGLHRPCGPCLRHVSVPLPWRITCSATALLLLLLYLLLLLLMLLLRRRWLVLLLGV
jgi:hypothetical protein